jgi:hypothetical protein
MIRTSIQKALLRALAKKGGGINISSVAIAKLVATNVHLDSGSLAVGKLVNLSDEILLNQLISLAVNKAFIEAGGITDTFVAHLLKNVSDVVSTGAVSDFASFFVEKNAAELPYITDNFTFDFNAAYADGWSVTDLPQIHFQPSYSEALAGSDSSYWFFAKNNFDTAAVSEAQVFSIGKNLTDTGGISETFDRQVDYIRNFFDSVTLTDSISPNILQGLNQFPANSAGISESAVFAHDKPVSDSWSVADLYANAFSKPVSEALSISEQVGKAPSLVKSDSADAADSPLLLLEKNFGTGLATGNTAEVGETTVFSLSLVRTETPSVSDVFAKSFSKVIADAADISDVFSLAEVVNPSNTANASDAAVFSLGANKSNTFDAADAYAAAFSKTLEDPANCSDTGVLLAQSYTSSGYFEDDFVGVKRTLT